MDDVISLVCPSCGQRLECSPALARIRCGSCGSEHVVHRVRRLVYLSPVLAHRNGTPASGDRTASEGSSQGRSEGIQDLKAGQAVDMQRQRQEAQKKLSVNENMIITCLWAGILLGLGSVFSGGVLAPLGILVGLVLIGVAVVGVKSYAIWEYLDRLASDASPERARTDTHST